MGKQWQCKASAQPLIVIHRPWFTALFPLVVLRLTPGLFRDAAMTSILSSYLTIPLCIWRGEGQRDPAGRTLGVDVPQVLCFEQCLYPHKSSFRETVSMLK